MRALTQAERDLFEQLLSGAAANLALVSTECNGIETACISRVETDGESYWIIPLAVLVNEEIFAMLKAP
jgi:hypothetical protein